MPLLSVDIQKVLGAEYWTNRYIVQAADVSAGLTIATQIANAEAQIHKTTVLIDKIRVSDMLPGTDVYIVDPVGIPGTRPGAGITLPLFNVVRVDFFTGTGGRPSRKYLRLPLLASDVEGNGNVLSGLKTIIQNSYGIVLTGLAGYVDVDGQELTAYAVFPQVGMRQLRRGTRRRTEPIIP